jgi:hypothetical protein
MATDTLVPNGDDGGWPTGAFGDIDETIASADGAIMSTTVDDDVVLLDLTSTVVADADTVTNVDIVTRAREGAGSAGNNRIGVVLVIGGVEQGAEQQTANMTTSFANVTHNVAAWNSDWTAAQLNGAQVRMWARQTGKAESATWEVDTVDVVITYTPSSTGRIMSSIVGAGGLVGSGGIAGSGGGLAG